MSFKKAVKEKLKARIALIGPSGGGKTYTALSIGKGLLPEGGKMAVIDTERGSASKYSDLFDFDVNELQTFEPQTYIAAIEDAAKAGYPVLIIDSMSHAWFAKGGTLEQVDNAAKRSNSGNSFTAWKDVTPIQNRFIDSILAYPGHVIVTLRVKMEYVLEKDEKTGKTAPKKVGLAPVQRDGLEYEFDLVGDMNINHDLIVTKTRCHRLADAVISKPDERVGLTMLEWLNDGVEKLSPLDYVKVEASKAQTIDELSRLKEECITAGGFYWTSETKSVLAQRGKEIAPQMEMASA